MIVEQKSRVGDLRDATTTPSGRRNRLAPTDDLPSSGQLNLGGSASADNTPRVAMISARAESSGTEPWGSTSVGNTPRHSLPGSLCDGMPLQTTTSLPLSAGAPLLPTSSSRGSSSKGSSRGSLHALPSRGDSSTSLKWHVATPNTIRRGSTRRGSCQLPGVEHADTEGDETRTSYLDELRKIDNELQRVHPTFAHYREIFTPCTPEQAAPRLLQLHKLQSTAISINLELIFHERLPDESSSRYLPSNAAPLLPRALARELRSLAMKLFAEPATALEHVSLRVLMLVSRLGVAEAAVADVVGLLDRVERAAEVWQIKAEKCRERADSKSKALPSPPPPPPIDVTKIVALSPLTSLGGDAAALEVLSVRGDSQADATSCTSSALKSAAGRRSSSLDDPGTEGRLFRMLARKTEMLARSGASGPPVAETRGESSASAPPAFVPPASNKKAERRSAKLPSRLSRLLGIAGIRKSGKYAALKALVARALALQIKRAVPGLPLTSFERAKVAHTLSLPNAVLESCVASPTHNMYPRHTSLRLDLLAIGHSSCGPLPCLWQVLARTRLPLAVGGRPL